MKRLMIISTVILLALLPFTEVIGCAAPEPVPTPTPAPAPVTPPPTPAPAPAPVPVPTTIPIKKITLSDASQVLDLLPLLPASFQKIDSASEGMSNADMELGPDFSEVELFISDEPFQMIYCYLGIVESRMERAGFDAVMKNEEMVKSMVIENLKAGALEEGVEVEEAEVQITYPAMADLSVLGEGYFSSFGLSVGFDMVFFRSNKVVVSILSTYFSQDRQALFPIAREIEWRIAQYSQ